MLERFRKFISANADNTVVASTTNKEGEVEMSKETMAQPEMAVDTNVAELVAQLASKASAFSELEVAFAELTSKHDAAVASLAAFHEEKALQAAEALKVKAQARKDALELAVGTEKAASLMSTLEVLDDAGFAAVVSSMSASLDKEGASASFKEVGVSASADVSKVVVEETALEAALKSKYQAK